jgi:N-acetyl-gamma-glutamyl-phosphate reductase
LTDAYTESPLVEIIDGQARIKDVVGSNRARIGLAVSGQSYALMCVIDNLGKGAAGGAMQWMNRLLGLEETTGLMAPGPGWT